MPASIKVKNDSAIPMLSIYSKETPPHAKGSMILTEKEQIIPKPEDEVAQKKKMSQKKLRGF